MNWAQTVYQFDKKNAEICREMQVTGFLMDQEKAAKLSQILLEKEDEAKANCIKSVGYEMNPFSTKDLRFAITKHFGAPIYFRSTATKNPLFHKEALRGYATAYDEELRTFALNVLIARNARALRKTCIEKPLSLLDADGRIHPSWLNYGAISGRFSCIEENQLVALARGRIPIKDVRVGDWAYTYDAQRKLTLRQVKRVLNNGSRSIVRLHWRRTGSHVDGYLDLTADHRVLLTNGKWVQAGELKPYDRLYALSHYVDRFGYERLYATGQAQQKAHILIARECIDSRAGANGIHVHHKDENKLNNSVDNLEVLEHSTHAKLHGAKPSAALRVKRSINAKAPKALARLANVRRAHPPKVLDLSRDVLQRLLDAADGKIKKASQLGGHDYMAFRGALVRAGFDIQALIFAAKSKARKAVCLRNNHMVLRVEVLEGSHTVYDLEIEGTHNFIVGEICVHNCHKPNLMNLPRHGSDPTAPFGGIRSLYIAPEGYELVYFDAKQIEMRVAAYLSNDPAMIKACEETDIHTANARVIFGEEAYNALGKDERDTLRTMAKSSGFAVCYLAEADTVYARLIADGVKVSLRQVEALLSKLRKAFEVYYGFQRSALLDAIRNGYVETPILGRRRFVGHTPGAPEVANYPIQGGAAEVVGKKLQKIVDTIKEKRYSAMKADLLAQVHDSGTFQCIKGAGAELGEICRKEFDSPIQIGQNTPSFPIDLKIIQAGC